MFEKQLKEALFNNHKREVYSLVHAYLGEDPSRILTLYETHLPTLMNAIQCDEDDMVCVFKEHQMSATVRAIIESVYPMLYDAKRTLSHPRHVLIACVQEETHELGALIGEQLLMFHGFKTTYLGANTPLESLLNALEILGDVDAVVLSATNPYNVSRLRATYQTLRTMHPTLKLFGAGRAVRQHASQLLFDGLLQSVADIKAWLEAEGVVCSH